MKTGTGLVTWRDLPRDKRYQMWFLSSSKPAESQAPRWLQTWKKMIGIECDEFLVHAFVKQKLWKKIRDQESESTRTSMILCYETPPPPWVWWKRFQQQTAEMFGAGRRGASSKWLKRTPASCCSRPRNLDKKTLGFTSQPKKHNLACLSRDSWASCLVCQLNSFHLFLFVCPFHSSGNYSNHTNHLLSTCSRCHWSGPGNGWKDRFKSWSAFFHPEFPCKPDKSSSNPPPIQLLPLEQFQKKQKSGEIV